MSKFDTYFLMKSDDVIGYVKEKLDMFSDDAQLKAKEIGDGNLNYVFIVWEEATGKSVIVKQAGGEARISSEIKLSTDRTRIESEVLVLHGKLAPGHAPDVYLYDPVMSTFCMEDLSEYQIMRTALMAHKTFPLFADHISTFMVNTLLLTTDICMEHKEKKEMVRSYINPELCEISEDLVYTEPYNNIGARNNVFPPNKEFIQKELYEDKALHLEVAKCKFDFMNNAQSLVHGDLHTGSVFITAESTKVIDPEFAFYGPMGYDIGNVIANMYFAWNNGKAIIEDEKKKEEFVAWVEDTMKNTIDLFIEKYNKAYDEHVTDHMAKTEGFKEWYLSTILRDTAAVTGLELIRRIVGLANVQDITMIQDEEARLKAEQRCILAGKHFIKDRNNFKEGQDFLDVFNKVATQID